MFSTRKPLTSKARLALALAAGAALAGGCARAPKPAPEPVSTAPVAVDEAMQTRADWPRATAMFEAGGVDAGATRFPYNPQTAGDDAGRATLGAERRNAVGDTLAFLVQTAKLPFTYFRNRPFVEKNYRGVIYDPTHWAMPVLPADEAPVEEGEERTAPPEPAPVPTEDAVEGAVDSVTTPDRQPTVAPGEVPPGQDPPEALPPVITPDSSLPAPAEPTGPSPEDREPGQTAAEPAPEPTPEAAEPTAQPMPEGAEPAPAPAEPAPETTVEPAPEPAPAPEETEPAPEAPAEGDLNK